MRLLGFPGLIVTILCAAGLPLGAAPAQSSNDLAAGRFPLYNPSKSAGGKTRVATAHRGPTSPLPDFYVLTPDHPGLTTRDQPDLYWFISEPVRADVEISIFRHDEPKPLLETRLKGITNAGIQKLSLGALGVRLPLDVEYEWAVSVLMHPKERAKDPLASGAIKRVQPEGEMVARLAKASEREKVAIYAGAGIWFETIDGALKLLELDRGNPELIDLAQGLCEQVGLHAIRIAAPKPVFNAVEAERKARLIYELCLMIQWPEHSRKAVEDRFVLGVLGGTDIFAKLSGITNQVHGKRWECRLVTNTVQIVKCHALFVPQTASARETLNVLTSASDDPLLTIGEHQYFLVRGGIINLWQRGEASQSGEILFDFSAENARRAKLQPSPVIERLAVRAPGVSF